MFRRSEDLPWKIMNWMSFVMCWLFIDGVTSRLRCSPSSWVEQRREKEGRWQGGNDGPRWDTTTNTTSPGRNTGGRL